MNEIKVIKTEGSHIEEIYKIEKQCFSTPWSVNSFLHSLNAKDTQSCYSAMLDNTVVGYIVLFHLFEEGELLNVATSPDIRNRGIGQKLIDQMVTVMKQKGVQRITLEVRRSNTPALSLYEKNGFSPISVRKNYYSNPSEDGIVMEKLI